MLTIVDLLVVAVVALSALRGWRLGLTGFAFGLAGLAAGIVLALTAANWVVNSRTSPLTGLLLEVGCVLGAALVGSALGRRLGLTVGSLLARIHLRLPDRAVGAAVRGVLALTICWLLAAVLTSVGPPVVDNAVAGSAVLRRVANVLSTPDRMAADLSRQLAAPADFAALVPVLNAGSATPSSAQVGAVRAAATGAVLKIEGTACGTAGVEGSGFVTAGELVVTNAHVVAGTRSLTVTDGAGRYTAIPVVVDSAADLAVLRVPGLRAPTLTLADEPAANGSPAVVLGYPGDGDLTASPAVIVQRLPVVQAGIGNDALTTRQVYRLAVAADTRQAASTGSCTAPAANAGRAQG